MNEPERASWCTRSIHVRRLGCWGQPGEALPKILRRRLSAKGVIGPDGQNVWIHYEMPYPLLERINRSGVPVYLVNGWYDIYARGNFMIYANPTVPKRLVIRPTDHAGIEAPAADIDHGAEAHRWFD